MQFSNIYIKGNLKSKTGKHKVNERICEIFQSKTVYSVSENDAAHKNGRLLFRNGFPFQSRLFCLLTALQENDSFCVCSFLMITALPINQNIFHKCIPFPALKLMMPFFGCI